ncbi:CYFA0S01e09516g1_1 [Cyberlindnera fabianii]|uniref:CYFA0S01e09516g1_1 n=1 Tax=Cyberlindnera fabianii TaxID=36022 RepID=A0A061ARG8_CYBFA|nr:CYFA0S01e09516g1_1 [Cyberlindnera fabianii]
MDPPGSGYKPPHLRQQDESFSSAPNGSSWRGRGRGSHGFRGSSQQNNSGNRQRRNQNFQSRYGSETGPIITASEEELERRRKRFGADSADAKKGDMGYGLVSRGEDNRLQRDPVARKTFFRDVLKELREALLNSVPDDFTKSVFMFSIRVSTRIGHYQTYIPSITYLLKHSRILSKPELNEVSSLYALHLAHFNNEHTKALEVLFDYSPDDLHLHQILTSFRNKEYHTWLNLFHKEKDVSKYRIMKFGEQVMVQHAIDCIQKSYFQLPSSYVDHLFEISVESLCKEYNCSWKKDNATVVIRERR